VFLGTLADFLSGRESSEKGTLREKGRKREKREKIKKIRKKEKIL
jgi:hypothetical protein